jgi:hypothetical protein
MGKLFDIAPSHALGEEAVRANFTKEAGKANPKEGDGVNQAWHGWNKKNRKHRDTEFVAAANHMAKQQTGRPTPARTPRTSRRRWRGHARTTTSPSNTSSRIAIS